MSCAECYTPDFVRKNGWFCVAIHMLISVMRPLTWVVSRFTDRCAEKLTFPGRRMGYGDPTLGIPGLEGMAADAGGEAEARGLVPAQDCPGARRLGPRGLPLARRRRTG